MDCWLLSRRKARILWLAPLISGRVWRACGFKVGEKRPMKVESRSWIGWERKIWGALGSEVGGEVERLRFCALLVGGLFMAGLGRRAYLGRFTCSLGKVFEVSRQRCW